jgi:hypothetical protein
MAYTRIHAIKATVNKSVAYICDPNKTDGQILVSSFGCSSKTAHHEFAFANGKNVKKDDILAHHLIQSFAPGEVSFDMAHQIGTELADRLLEGKYSYVIATHIEKNHVHNHIIFCATDNIDHKKYNSCKKSYFRIRRLSDELCVEHQLSVIDSGPQRGKKRNEWEAGREGSSWKEKLRQDIDTAIKLSESYEDFIRLMKSYGYEIKGEDADSTLKYISFRPTGKERFVRGSAKSLGADYTREKIQERILNREQNRNETRQRLFTKRKDFKPRDYSKRTLIDTSGEKFAESPGLKHWADIENLKIAASAYADAKSLTALEQQISQKRTAANEAKSELVALERKMKSYAEILKYAEQYAANKPYHFRYKKSKNPDEYFRNHETELILYDGARNMLRKSGLDLKNLNIENMRAEYRSMQTRKAELQKSHQSADRETAELERKRQTLNQYLGRDTAVEPPENPRPRKSHSL